MPRPLNPPEKPVVPPAYDRAAVRELARCFARAAVDALLKAEREAPEQQAEPAPTKSKKTQE